MIDKRIFRAPAQCWPDSNELIQEARTAARSKLEFAIETAKANAKRNKMPLLEWLRANLIEQKQLQEKVASGYEAARAGGPEKWSSPDWFRVIFGTSRKYSERGHQGTYIFDLWNLTVHLESQQLAIHRLEQGLLFDEE